MIKMRDESGYTIVEVIVGISVIAIFTGFLTVMVTNLTAINDRAQEITLANALAENKIETLRSADFSTLSDGSTDFSSELPATFEPGTATYTVSEVQTGLKQIDISIDYTSKGKAEQLQFSTYIGELGVAQ